MTHSTNQKTSAAKWKRVARVLFTSLRVTFWLAVSTFALGLWLTFALLGTHR